MAKMYYEVDANLELLKGKVIAVMGYGSQGHAQAQNLKDSGLKVLIGLRPGSARWKRAEDAGFEVMTVSEAAARADIIQILLPDETQSKVYENEIKQHLTSGKALVFPMALIFTLAKLFLPVMSTFSWLHQKVRGIWSAEPTLKALEYHL